MPSIEELTKQVELAKLQQQLAEARRDEAKALKETTANAKGTESITKLGTPQAPQTKPPAEGSAKPAADATNDLIAAYSKALKEVAVTPPDGKITVTGESIEGRVLAQHTLSKVLTAFLNDFALTALAAKDAPAKDAAGANSKSDTRITLVLIQPADVAALELHGPTLQRLKLLLENYSDAVQQAQQVLESKDDTETAGIAMVGLGMTLPSMAATTVVSSAAKLLALFRTTTSFTNTALSVDSTLLTSTLVQAARKHEKARTWQVFAPSLFPIDALQGEASPFLEAIAALEDLHSTGQQVVHALEARVQALLMTPSAQQGAAEGVNAHLSRLKAFDESYNQLQLGLVAADSPIVSLAKSERLVHQLLQPHTYPVFLTATSKGSTQIKSWLFVSDRLRFSAGTELSYLVFEENGAISCAGSVCEYTPYIKSAEIPATIAPSKQSALTPTPTSNPEPEAR